MSVKGQALYAVFKRQLAEAEALEGSKKYAMASQMYIESAKSLLHFAKETEGALQRAQIEASDRLAEHANALLKRCDDEKGESVGDPEKAAESEWKIDKIPGISFDDVAGLEDVKRIVRERVIGPMKNAELYKQMNLKPGTGLMLFGPPGTGKTTIARAIAHEVNAPIFVVDSASIVSKFLGEAESRLHSLFESARKHEACVIFFDDFESIARERDDSHDAIARMVSQLLVEMDGFRENENNLLLIAATNKPWMIDPALKRPGRFSNEVYVPLPDEQARLQLMKIQTKKTPMAADVRLDDYACMSAGFSGGDIKALCDEAKMSAIRRAQAAGIKDARLTGEDFMDAFRVRRPSVNEEILFEYREYLEERGIPVPDEM